MSRYVNWLTIVCLAVPTGNARAEEPTAAEVDAYVKKIEASHKKLEAAGREFGKTLGPAISGNDADRLAANRQYRRMSQVLREVMKETKGWKVPDHAAVRELAQANDRFLDYQLEAALSVIPGVLDLVEDSDLSADEKLQKIRKLLESGNDKEKEIGAKVRDAVAKAKSEFKLR